MDQQIWQWTLTRDAIAPCFVRDVLSMSPNANTDVDFFWLGHTPCRVVLLVGMVVGVQVYDKRSIYTIDDGTAVVDCILRHPRPEPKPRPLTRPVAGSDAKPNHRCPSPKKIRPDKTKESTEPPPPVTELGYPVRVVGRVARHYGSKQIHAETIDPCISSLDEITHLERVIDLHKKKYSLSVPFALPSKPWGIAPLDTSTRDPDTSIFSDTSHPSPGTVPYSLRPPPIPILAQDRSRPSSIQTNSHTAYSKHTHHPSSPTGSSIVSSTPSSPCKLSSPNKAHEVPSKPKLRHPSRLHSRDLNGNTFRLYVKHYMDNAPLPCPVSTPSSSRNPSEKSPTTPTKRERDGGYDEPTPRPRFHTKNEGAEEGAASTLGFTLSHLRRVPELALLAARVVRAESRKRDKAEREKERATSQSHIKSSALASARSRGSKEENGAMPDPPRKKIKRLFTWALVKLHEEGSIVLWDGDARPLPVPPPVLGRGGDEDKTRLWKVHDTQSTFEDPSMGSRSHTLSTLGDPFSSISILSSLSASVLYASSASASLYSDYHPPRRSAKHSSKSESGQTEEGAVDEEADPGNVSDPGMDEEAYVPLTSRLLAGYVKEAIGALRHRSGGDSARRSEPTPEDILKYLLRKDGRWARVGVWTVEGAVAVLKTG